MGTEPLEDGRKGEPLSVQRSKLRYRSTVTGDSHGFAVLNPVDDLTTVVA